MIIQLKPIEKVFVHKHINDSGMRKKLEDECKRAYTLFDLNGRTESQKKNHIDQGLTYQIYFMIIAGLSDYRETFQNDPDAKYQDLFGNVTVDDVDISGITEIKTTGQGGEKLENYINKVIAATHKAQNIIFVHFDSKTGLYSPLRIYKKTDEEFQLVKQYERK